MRATFNGNHCITIISCNTPITINDETDIAISIMSYLIPCLTHPHSQHSVETWKEENDKFSPSRNGEHRADFSLKNRFICVKTEFSKRKKNYRYKCSRRRPEGFLFNWDVGKGVTPFPGLTHFTLDTYLIMLNVKQDIKYYFLRLLLPLNRTIGPLGRVFTNGPGDRGSILVLVIPKTQKMVLDAGFLNTQHYKVRVKGKVGQSREWSNVLLYISVW